jgi:septin family protein
MIARYASEALKQQTYKDHAGAQLREFNKVFQTSKGHARDVLEASGVDAIAVPLSERDGAVVYVERVRRTTPGTVTMRRLEEFLGRAPVPEEMSALPSIVREVESEVQTARDRSTRAQEAEEKRRRREEARAAKQSLRDEKERVKQERAAAKAAMRSSEAALERRVRHVQRALRDAR